MKNKLFKRLLSFVLSLAIVFGMVPMAPLTAFADGEDSVYLSVSFDGQYITDKNGTPMTNIEVPLSKLQAMDLNNYANANTGGLMGYDYGYDPDGDGVYNVTALHLMIYAHTELYGGVWEEVSVSGSQGSIFFERNIFGFTDCNFIYYHNGEYPLQSEGWGATADICLLNAGDRIDVSGFTSWGFYGDSNAGFKYFTDGQGKIVNTYTAVQNEAMSVNLVKAAQDMMGGTGTATMPHSAQVYYSKTPFDSNAQSVSTDADGKADITFGEAGTWYIWSLGEYGFDMDPSSVVNAPAYAVVKVEGSNEPEPPVNNVPALAENYVSGTGAATITVGEEYSINLAEVFTDADGDTLKYFCNDTELADTVYTVAPAEAGTQTLAFKANDGKADSDIYTVTLTVTAPAKEPAKLNSLVIYTGKGAKPTSSSAVVSDDTATHKKALAFDADVLEYEINTTILDTAATTQILNFCAVADEGEKVTLCYGDTTKDITGTSGSYIRVEDILKPGRNEFTIIASSDETDIAATTYKFIVRVTPTLLKNALTVQSNKPFYLKTNIGTTTTKGELIIPETLNTITLKAAPKGEDYTVTYNGNISETVDITGKDKVEIIVSKDDESKAYNLTLTRVPEKTVTFNTTPADAAVKVTYGENISLTANENGSYDMIFYQVGNKVKVDKIVYKYEVSKDGYVTKTGEVTSFEGDSLTVDVELSKELCKQPDEISDVDWKNFRNSDVNMAITAVQTPKDKVALKWNKTLGTGWGGAPSVPIIVDNKIVVMTGKKLYMLDAESGEIKKQADMVSTPNFGYTPPTYANGMIFCPLSNGTIQAFDANTLESLWVYSDPLGGQSLSPIAYSSKELDDRTCGYIYTGFWNGESGEANYVCIDVTDYDDENDKEPKSAVWTHKQKGGFYWAGAVAVGDAVIVGTDDGDAEGTDAGSYLYSFNKNSGEILSEIALATDAGDQRSSIAYENGKIYFTTKGGYLYSAKVNDDGSIEELKGVNYNAQITSTPVVYKGKIYFGIGSGIRTDGSEGSFVVADAETLEKIFEIEMIGYPQGSALLSTAYEADGWLYFYMTYNDSPGGISLIKVKNDAQTAADAQLVEIYDAAGFEQFSIASIICDENGTLYYKNDSANLMAVAPAVSATVADLIEKIGTVTLESGSAIKAAREAYDSLSETEKAKVENYDKLEKAEKTFEELVQVEQVEELIDDIRTVSIDTFAKLEKARKAYDELSKEQKTLVENYNTLLEAEDEAVDQVEDYIDKIGEVGYDSSDDIAKAKKVYNALPEYLQKKVSNYDKLKTAEKTFDVMRTEAIELLANGKLVLSKSELLELKGNFEEITENTGYDAVLALMRTYARLGEKQQLALKDTDGLKLAQQIIAAYNHEDASTGIKTDDLEWNIRLVVENTDGNTAETAIVEAIENSTVLELWNIYLEDVITGEKYIADKAIRIKVPAALLGDWEAYDELCVVHYTDDGEIEVLKCITGDEYISFNAAEFSIYAVVGMMEENSQTENHPAFTVPNGTETGADANANSGWLIWVIIAAVGVAALAGIIVLRKRTENEE